MNGSTTYNFGQGTGSLADVKDGEGVHVAGTVTADNTMTATNVRVGADRAVGKVTAKTANVITIERRNGSSLTIHVDADTTYRVAGVETADLGDVAVDMAIGVTGRTRADGSLDADVVAAGKLRGFGRGGLDGQKGAGGFGPGASRPKHSRPSTSASSSRPRSTSSATSSQDPRLWGAGGPVVLSHPPQYERRAGA